MTTSVSSPAALTPAQAAAQAALANATSTTGSSNSASASTLTNPLISLGQNFTDFLQLLTTQLQNQDPTSPMDTNQFTQELVTFTGVQQSVATNSNLSQLISLTQGSETLQSVGKTIIATSPQIALQGGTGTITFNTPAAEPVTLAIVNAAGQTVMQGTLSSAAGSNTWVWNGQDSNGNTLPDGAYGIALETGNGGAAEALPFSVIGTVTGVTNTSSGMVLDMGAVAVPSSEVTSVN